MLYLWPDDGWQRGSAARLCARGAFSHVVANNRQASALRGGHAPRRRLLRLPLGASLPGPGGVCDPGPSTPGPPTLSLTRIGRWLVTAPGPGPVGQRTFAWNVLLFTPCVASCSILMARVTSRDNERHDFASHGFLSPSLPDRRSAAAERVDSSSVLAAFKVPVKKRARVSYASVCYTTVTV